MIQRAKFKDSNNIIRTHKNVTCKFNKKYHQYTVNGNELISGTTIVSQCFPKFDTERISARYAAKHGLYQQDVIDMWAEEGRISSKHGSNCHSFAESLILQKKPYPKPQTKKEQIHFKHIYNYIKKLSKKYKFVDTEAILFSVPVMIAGMADLILYDKSKKQLIILDWKTNKKMELYSKFNKTGLDEFEHLDDCNLNHYYLQLNLYRALIAVEDFYIDKYDFNIDEIVMVLLHVTDEGIMPYVVPDFTHEIKLIFNKRL